MDKSKSLKKAYISILIFGIVAFVAWAVLFVVFGLGIGVDFFKGHLQAVFEVFKFDMSNLVTFIVVMSLLGILAIFLILTIILSAVKRRGLMVLPFILLMFITAGGIEFACNFRDYGNLTIGNTARIVMAIAILVSIGLAYILMFIAYIFAMVHTCKYPGGTKEIVDDLDEVNVDNEPAGQAYEQGSNTDTATDNTVAGHLNELHDLLDGIELQLTLTANPN